MKNHLRARGLDERAQRRAVIDIRLDEAAAFRQHQNVMQVGTRIRCQSKTGHFRAHFAQPKRQRHAPLKPVWPVTRTRR
jgi:hypothetical protein